MSLCLASCNTSITCVFRWINRPTSEIITKATRCNCQIRWSNNWGSWGVHNSWASLPRLDPTTISNELDFDPEEDAESTMNQISRALTKDDIIKSIRKNEPKKFYKNDYFTKSLRLKKNRTILVFTDPETNLKVITNNYYGSGRPSLILKVMVSEPEHSDDSEDSESIHV